MDNVYVIALTEILFGVVLFFLPAFSIISYGYSKSLSFFLAVLWIGIRYKELNIIIQRVRNE